MGVRSVRRFAPDCRSHTMQLILGTLGRYRQSMLDLTTERLRLRTIAREDEPLLAALAQRPEVTRYIGSVGQPSRAGGIVLVISLDGVGIGVVGVVSSGALDGTEIELFVALTENAEGCGFAYESCRSLILFVRTGGRWKRILASVDRSNHRSADLLKRLGFSYLSKRPLGDEELFELVL
jgi:RimJ/RimL family protein N-acetyltransferase